MARLLIILLICVAGLGVAMWDMVRSPRSAPTDSRGQHAATVPLVPDAAFRGLDGTAHTLHAFAGRTVILNFWATWCAPCIKEFPELMALAEQQGDRIVLVALSVDEDPSAIPPFIRRFDATVQQQAEADNVIIAHDPGKAISRDLFQTLYYPETLVIGPDLTIHQKFAGMVTQDQLHPFITTP